MISFLIPFESEDPHRVRSYEYNKSVIEANFPDAEVLYGGACQSGQRRWFNRAVARNTLAEMAHGDVLAFVDADSIVPHEQLAKAFRLVGKGMWNWCLPYDVYYNLSQVGTEAFYRKELGLVDGDYEHMFPSANDPEPAVGGCVIMSKEAYSIVEGYDERFQGWGEEDRALVLCLETLCGSLKRIDGPIYHLWHQMPEEERFGQPHFLENRALGNRYREAHWDRNLMSILVGEHLE